MKTQASVLPLWLLVLGVAALLAAPTCVLAEKQEKADGKEAELLKKASVNGKYSKLLKKIEVPADKETYGEFNDYGQYAGTEWAGFKDLPPGYWVYVAPHWYIWGEQKKAEGKEAELLKKASVDGKYAKLLKKIKVAEDKEEYGEFNDYGYYEGTEWAGYKDLPVGYWVYVAPHWYIWKDEVKK